MLSDGSFEELPSFPVKSYDIDYEDIKIALPYRKEPYMLCEVADGKITLDEFMSQMKTEEMIFLLGGHENHGVANTAGFGGINRLGIPEVFTVDGPAGVRLSPKVGIPTTSWPCATLIACTWDPDLAYEIGKAGALEAKENGLAIWLTPALNIHRNPLCGRNFEYFSEDPLIAGKFAAAKIRGIQSQNIAASAKHFAANNREENRFYSDSRVSERALREIYLKGFEICVKESDPWTIMTSYNVINGRRCCESYEQIEGILRGEWEYKGMVTTDWEVPCYQPNCVKAGNDIRMPYGKLDEIREAYRNGELSHAQIYRCAKRILEFILKLD